MPRCKYLWRGDCDEEESIGELMDNEEEDFRVDGIDLEEELDLDFGWTDNISELEKGMDWGPSSRVHQAALKLLWKAVSLLAKDYQGYAHSIRG
jgi:hypothetical protein